VYNDNQSYEPLARIDVIESPEIFWFHCAANGTPELLTGVEGQKTWEGINSPWGKLLRESNQRVPGYNQNLRMQGQYMDRETGLHYNLFRYYDPDSGRFTQQDPIGLAGGINLYQYAPNALGWVDPWGLSRCSSNKRPDPYNGTKEASAYLRSKGIDRATRKQIIDSFERGTISVEKAGKNQFGTRFHDNGKSAWPLGQYVFETFTPLTNRSGLALPYEWNRMTGIKQWQIKPNSTIIRGRAAPQFEYGSHFSGGEEQIFVLQPWKYGTLL